MHCVSVGDLAPSNTDAFYLKVVEQMPKPMSFLSAVGYGKWKHFLCAFLYVYLVCIYTYLFIKLN